MATTGAMQGVHETEGSAEGSGGKAEIANPLLGAIPPGALPQINIEAAGGSGDAEPFLALAPQGRGTILGYGHARVGRVPPYGGSPSSGPLTGLPLQALRPPPVPPVFRRQALEPGHREPDPFRKLPYVETGSRAPEEILLEGLEGIGRSATALRSVPEPRRGGAGRHAPLVGAVSPAGSGGARVAASVGVPVADSVRTSDRGLYVAGRASGARWDSNGSVAPRPPAGDGGSCPAPGAPPKGRPLTHLQSAMRYSRQRQEGKKREDHASEAPTPMQVQSPGASAYSRVASKAVSPAFKALSKTQIQGPRGFRDMEGTQGAEEGTKPDLDRERSLLAGRAMLTGLGGRFGASSRCLVDPTGALRPARGLLDLRREQGSAQRLGREASHAYQATAPGTKRVLDPASFRVPILECDAVPQKYAAEAGVRMRNTGASAATAAAPPDGAAFAPVDGVPTERQAPWGQEASPGPAGSKRHALAERSPGDGAARRIAQSPAPNVDARGMGGPSAPVLLEIDRRLRAEAAAMTRAREGAEVLTREIDAYLRASHTSIAYFQTHEKAQALEAELSGTIEDAFRDMDRLDGVSAWSEKASAIVGWIRANRKVLGAANDVAAGHLATMGIAADRLLAEVEDLRREREGVRSASRVLGNMDRATLARRAGEAARRAGREMFRAQRRALRRERNGAYLVRQFAKAEAAYERATSLDARADRYRARVKALANRPGWDRELARANADYYASLAEHEEHRAALAQSHIVSQEAGKLRGFGALLAEQRRAEQQALRNERQSIDLERSMRIQESQLRALDDEIRQLVTRDADGNYVLNRKSDSWRLGVLTERGTRLLSSLGKTRGRWAAVPDGQLGSVRNQIRSLVRMGPSGLPLLDENKDYVPELRSDRLSLRILQKKEQRLQDELRRREERIAAAGRSELDAVEHEIAGLMKTDEHGNQVLTYKSDALRLRTLRTRQRLLGQAAKQAEGPGSPQSRLEKLISRRNQLVFRQEHRWAARAVLPKVFDSQVQSALAATQRLLNFRLSQFLRDAVGRAEAALAAGKNAAIARYDPTLSNEQRQEAAQVHEQALAAARKAVADIQLVIANKKGQSEKEKKRDQKALARAQAIVDALQPCASDACATARDECKDKPPKVCEFRLKPQPEPRPGIVTAEQGIAPDLAEPPVADEAVGTPGSEESDATRSEDAIQETEGTVTPSEARPGEPSPEAPPDSDRGDPAELIDEIGGFIGRLAGAAREAGAEAIEAVQSAVDRVGGFVESFAKSVEQAVPQMWDSWIAGLADAYAVAKVDRTVDLSAWNTGLQEVLVKVFVTGVTERLQHGYTLEQAESEAVGDVEGVDRIWRRALGMFPYGPKPGGIPDLDYGRPLVRLPSGELLQVQPLAENRALRIGEMAIRGVGAGFFGAVAGLGDLLGIDTPFSDDLLAVSRADLAYSASQGRIGTPEKIAGVAGEVVPYLLIPGSAFATPLRAVVTGGAIGLVTTEGGAKEKTVATLVGMASFGLGSKLKQAASPLYAELLGGTATRFAPHVVNPLLDASAFTSVAAVEQQFRPEAERVPVGDLFLGNLLSVSTAHSMGIGLSRSGRAGISETIEARLASGAAGGAGRKPLPIPKDLPWRYAKPGELKPRELGITTKKGEIIIRRGLNPRLESEVIREEAGHRFLTPFGDSPVATFRQNAMDWFYRRSAIMRLSEEMLAKTYATRSPFRAVAQTFGGGYRLTPGWGDLIVVGIVVGAAYVAMAPEGSR